MSFFGFILSALAIAAGLGVVVFRNPLFSAFSLVTNMLAVAGLYAMLNAHFLAATQVIVYAGAVMVLVLFVLMLLNLKAESGRSISVGSIGIVIVAALTCFTVVVPPLLQLFSAIAPYVAVDNARKAEGTVKNIGLELFQQYIVQFELASLVILVGVVGAVMLANRRKGVFQPADDSGTEGSEVKRAA